MTRHPQWRWLLLAACGFTAANAAAQDQPPAPRIGYLYPAGGQCGSTTEILVGGQHLHGVREAHVSGAGVHAEVIEHYRPLRNLEPEQRQALRRTLRTLITRREREAGEQGPTAHERSRPRRKARNARALAVSTEDFANLPVHPLLRDLPQKSLAELRHVEYTLKHARKGQINRQLAESVLLRVTFEPDAEPGDRELRLRTPRGLTNPLCLQVGLLPEHTELEPNGPFNESVQRDTPALELPLLLNGQIGPGDIDRFRFRAEPGQRLVVDVDARRLIPYLADAVPGWFQATIALYDDLGREVAFNDDYRFEPDPVLLVEIDRGGEYLLEIRDALYRGREDFVYRIRLGEQPFITAAFPLGAPAGRQAITNLTGWNLPSRRVALDTDDGERIRETAWQRSNRRSNAIAYAVDNLPTTRESEPNDTLAKAQRVGLPRAINARIDHPGDVDVFRFHAAAGNDVVAEVFGRRLLSPIDALLRLTDDTGHVRAWNDDHTDPEAGLCTHHADAYLRTHLPADGHYYLHVRDVQGHGGPAYAYRLRLEPPRPDFALRITPSSVNLRGAAAPIDVHAIRKDGFDGDILVALTNPTSGFSLDGGRIPAGCDRIRMTLTPPRQAPHTPVELHLEGRAIVQERDVRHPAVPAEDLMQAFLYRHLAPSQLLLVDVINRRSGPRIHRADDRPVRIRPGHTATVRFRLPAPRHLSNLQLRLSDPPVGIALDRHEIESDELILHLRATADSALLGLADNLIVEAYLPAKTSGDTKKRRRPRTHYLGALPAIPIEITDR